MRRKPLFQHSQIVKLVRLMDMMYRPKELAEEIGVSVDTVYRSYLPAGCPHQRETSGEIWINGLDFQAWVREMQANKKRGKNHTPMPENQAFCMRCDKPVEMISPRVIHRTRNMELLQGRCAVCGCKVNRARSTRGNLNQQTNKEIANG